MTSEGDYALRRDYLASSGLNLQSHIWRDSLGYTLHPKIDTAVATVADVGTGTGGRIWLASLALDLNVEKVKLDGFDIDTSQCPSKEWMPDNGVYDVVHIRLFMINIRDNDASAVISNVFRMLKPDVWLQWEEIDNTRNHIVKVDESIETPAMEALLEYVDQGSLKHRGKDDWFLSIIPTLEGNGFGNVDLRSHEDPPMLRRWVYETWLLTLEEFSTTRLRGTEHETIDMGLIRESHEECKKGAVIQLGKLVRVAQKKK